MEQVIGRRVGRVLVACPEDTEADLHFVEVRVRSPGGRVIRTGDPSGGQHRWHLRQDAHEVASDEIELKRPRRQGASCARDSRDIREPRQAGTFGMGSQSSLSVVCCRQRPVEEGRHRIRALEHHDARRRFDACGRLHGGLVRQVSKAEVRAHLAAWRLYPPSGRIRKHRDDLDHDVAQDRVVVMRHHLEAHRQAWGLRLELEVPQRRPTAGITCCHGHRDSSRSQLDLIAQPSHAARGDFHIDRVDVVKATGGCAYFAPLCDDPHPALQVEGVAIRGQAHRRPRGRIQVKHKVAELGGERKGPGIDSHRTSPREYYVILVGPV